MTKFTEEDLTQLRHLLHKSPINAKITKGTDTYSYIHPSITMLYHLDPIITIVVKYDNIYYPCTFVEELNLVISNLLEQL